MLALRAWPPGRIAALRVQLPLAQDLEGALLGQPSYIELRTLVKLRNTIPVVQLIEHLSNRVASRTALVGADLG